MQGQGVEDKVCGSPVEVKMGKGTVSNNVSAYRSK